MKHIVKQGAPRKYLDWCKKAAPLKQNDYTHLYKDEKDVLLKSLIREQGYICAYTMRRIDENTSHVEHIKPETLLRAEDAQKGIKGSDLNYNNLVACFPRDNNTSHIEYGAKYKDKWWKDDGANFISPLQKTCETKIQFNIKGEVIAINNNQEACITIKVLNLDHKSLTADRNRVIREFIYGKDGQSPISGKKLDAAIREILWPNNQCQYHEFCKAIKDALLQYKAALDKRAQKKKYAQVQIKKRII